MTKDEIKIKLFDKRFQKILVRPEKTVRAPLLDELYAEVYKLRCRLNIHDLPIIRCLQLEEKIREAIEDAGACWPGFLKQKKSFNDAIIEASKLDTPKKQHEAFENIIANATHSIRNDACTKEHLQPIIDTCNHFLKKMALPEAPSEVAGNNIQTRGRSKKGTFLSRPETFIFDKIPPEWEEKRSSEIWTLHNTADKGGHQFRREMNTSMHNSRFRYITGTNGNLIRGKVAVLRTWYNEKMKVQ